MASGTARWLAEALDSCLERHDQLPSGLQTELLELEGYFGGLRLADDGDSGNASFSWVRSMLIRMARDKRLFHTPIPADAPTSALFELLGQQYIRFGDWSTATECFSAALMYRPRRKSALRKIMCQVIICELRAGAWDRTREWLDMMPDRISHRPSRHFRSIAEKLVTADAEIDTQDEENLHDVQALGIINYTYLASCVARKLAGDGHYERAVSVATITLERLQQAEVDDWFVGELEQQAASIYTAMRQHENARRLAVAAWAKLDTARYRACSHTQRQSTWRAFAPSRYAALRASVELGDARGVAELIESSRLQSLIATEIEIDHQEEKDKIDATGVAVPSQERAAGDEQPGENVMMSSAVFTAIGDAYNATRLQSQASIKYQGVSLFASEYAITAGGGQAGRALDDALPDGAFWSSHIENGFLFWFLAVDGGPVDFGVMDLRQHQNLTPVLLGLAGHSNSAEPETWNLPPHRQQSGEYYEPYTHLASWKSPEEQIISHTIGELLPETLVDLLKNSAKPLEITIAAARELGCVPWPIAILSGTEDRLVEHAILRMWTSTPTQLNRSSRPRPCPGTPIPFVLTCDNPDGTLRERTAISPATSAKTVLGGPGSAVPATKNAVLHALHEIGPGTPGLFFYRGHGVHDSDPAWSALPLVDGSIQAGELFGTLDGGTPFLPMPSRAIISGCSTSGGSLLAGEGLGLAAGLIQAGAEQVITTATDVIDTSFTEAFEDMLIKGSLAPDGDNAVLLRAAQLKMLHEWKLYSLRGGISHREDIKDPHPIIWAAYHAY